jgi:hypothetical protein
MPCPRRRRVRVATVQGLRSCAGGQSSIRHQDPNYADIGISCTSDATLVSTLPDKDKDWVDAKRVKAFKHHGPDTGLRNAKNLAAQPVWSPQVIYRSGLDGQRESPRIWE